MQIEDMDTNIRLTTAKIQMAFLGEIRDKRLKVIM